MGGRYQRIAVTAAGHQAVLDLRSGTQLLDKEKPPDEKQQDDHDRRKARGLSIGCLFVCVIPQKRVMSIQRSLHWSVNLEGHKGSPWQKTRDGCTLGTQPSNKGFGDVHEISHLGQDPRFAALIARVGPPRLDIDRQRSPYEALVRAIAHQQLHGRAAEAILRRFSALFPGEEFPRPDAVMATAETALRGCGFSAGKVAAIRDICAKALDGTVPTRRQSHRLSDAALIERLTTIRGVGRWTVEMLLIFTLGRPDVLPVDDFGVREGYRVLHSLDAQPKPKALAQIGLAWAPYRSVATWYLYRAAEEDRQQGQQSRA